MATDGDNVVEQVEWRVRFEADHRATIAREPFSRWYVYPDEASARRAYADPPLHIPGRATALQRRSVLRTTWVTVMVS